MNKTETRVTLRFEVRSSSLPVEIKEVLATRLGSRLTKSGALLISRDNHRERQRNLKEALEGLTELLEEALTERTRRRKTRPSRGAKQRRLTEKRKTAEKKRGRGPVTED